MCSPSSNTIRKRVKTNSYFTVGADREFDVLRDTQDIDASPSPLAFFPASTNASSVRQDYQHPLAYDHVVTSIRGKSTAGAIRSTDLTTVDVHAILNALHEAQLAITGNDGDSVLGRVDIDKVMNLAAAGITKRELGADADGNDEWVLHLPAGGYYDLNQGIKIVEGDNYGAEIRFEDDSAFPAAGDYEGKQLGLKVDLKVAVPSSE